MVNESIGDAHGMGTENIWLSWSSGKDSAWALHRLRDQGRRVTALETTVNHEFDRVAMHAVRRELLVAQAVAVGLPLICVEIPHNCSNEQYEGSMQTLLKRAVAEGVTHFAFGDLYLQDIRDYRVKLLSGTGIEPIFPLWNEPTRELAGEMIRGGLRARLTCVDPRVLAPRFCGREFDQEFLGELPSGIDPCGENGEFHSFAYAGPMFQQPLRVKTGEQVERGGFVFSDLMLSPPSQAEPTELR